MKLEFKKLNYDLYIKIYNFLNYIKHIENNFGISIKLRYLNFLKKKYLLFFIYF